MSKILEGVAVAMITPFTADGKVAVDAVAPMVEHFIAAGVNGLYLCGSTGSGIAMTVDERKQMTKAVCDAVGGKIPVISMVGACPIEDACELAKHCKEVGVSVISATVPGAYAWLRGEKHDPNLAEAVAYFKTLAGATDLPFWPYWLGGSLAASAQEFLDAVKDVPNFHGMKYTTPDMFTFQQIKYISEADGKPLNLLTGCDEMYICGNVMGADGGIGSTYNVMPKLFAQLYGFCKSGDYASAKKLQININRVIALLIDTCNCRDRGTNIIAGIMAVLRTRGHAVGHAREAVLSQPFSAEQEKALLDGLAAMDFTVE